MLGTLIGNCCVTDEAPCVRMLRDPNAEIFDSQPRLPSAAEELIPTKVSMNGVSLPAGPQERIIRTFATAEEEPLRGQPLRSGSILQLKLGVAIEDIVLTLYINGFSRTPQGAGHEGRQQTSHTCWSPFSLVEKCQVKTMQHSNLWAVFKLTVFRQEGDDRYYYFATTGKDAFRERDQWVEDISNAIRQVTLSLFPQHTITVRPLPGAMSTSTRIMAGYLLRSQPTDVVSLYYCELHSYSNGGARLAIYKDEWCEREVFILMLTDQTVVSTRKGSYCTVFGVDQHRFCARTKDEKELWLRAVSNIKVKLMFDAPEPTDEELAVFRAAVLERIMKLEENGNAINGGSTGSTADATWDPLLPQVPRPPLPMSPRGDVWHPEPVEEAEADEPVVPQPLDLPGQDIDEGIAASAAKLRALTSEAPAEALQPDDCRKLLANVGPMVMPNGVGSCGDIDSGIIAHEHPGDIRTVHNTRKVLVAYDPPECSAPAEICAVTCIGTSPEAGGRGPATPARPMVPAQVQGDVVQPVVPLLMWSPGRRQQSQRAV